jgi:exopolysaccharide biosynthesis polyprenyl glycosylphosphotransferase
MPLIALAVRLDSPGPVFFRQERVGKGEQPFTLIKFRTMRNDAEKNGAVWACKDDPRVTKVGHILRKTRLDEIPQLFNVLKGDMSFVGPRPERPEFVETLKEKIPYYSKRHFVKPGVTGWAQVRYPYGASVEDSLEKLRYDLYYIKNFSIFLDILIILETIKVVLFGRGAR